MIVKINLYVKLLRIIVWTSARDCQIIFYNLKKDNYKIEYNIPTRGFVFYITICLIDTSWNALGVSDRMLYICNLFEAYKTSFEITMLWQKIKGNLRFVSSS